MAVLTLAEMQESVSMRVCQKSYSYPEGIAVLEQVIRDATQAREHRYALRAPHAGDRLWERMRFFLRRLLRRTLNDLAKAKQVIPSARDLRDAVEGFIYGEYGTLVYEQEPGEQRRSAKQRDLLLDGHEAVIRLVRNVVAYTKKRWKPAWITRAVEAGRSGGTKSRRGPTWTDEDLAELANLDGKTVKEQAFLLGRSASTINRMRRALKEQVVSRNEVAGGAEIAEIRGSKEDSETVGADLGPEPEWPGEVRSMQSSGEGAVLGSRAGSGSVRSSHPRPRRGHPDGVALISGVSGNDSGPGMSRSGHARDLSAVWCAVPDPGDARHPHLLRAHPQI